MGGGAKLPYDAEVEYLECTGTQFIDTELLADNDFEVSLKIRTPLVSVSNGEYSIYGCYVGTGGKMCYLSYIKRDTRRFGGGWDGFAHGSVYVDEPYDDNDFEFIHSKSGLYVNGVKLKSYSANVINYSGLTLRVMSTTGGPGNSFRGRCYYFKIVKNRDTVIDLIPVRKGLVGYMYDRVSGRLFGTSGTGEFIVGPDL